MDGAALVAKVFDAFDRSADGYLDRDELFEFFSKVVAPGALLKQLKVETIEAAAEALLKSGHDLGPLHGIPYAVKDLYDIVGLPTTAGSRTVEMTPKTEESEVTKRLAAAGMVVLGKTITVEFAKGIVGINNIQGTPHNPWAETHHVPGGSSAGTAVAVASGMAPMGLGSDTGGSVRVPAGLSGTVGLKSTVGRVSRFGIFPLSWTFDSVGPLTRSVEDAALVSWNADLSASMAHSALWLAEIGILGVEFITIFRS